jgi:hypothetical protein
MLSGTPFPNRLTDGFAYVDLLPGEPFQSSADVLRIFSNDENHRHLDTLQPSRVARFLKYFLSFSYGNTVEWLNLPACHEQICYFRLPWDVEAQVAHYVQRFVDAISRSDTNTMGIDADDEASNDIMKHAIRARVLAWLDNLCPTQTVEALNRIKKSVTTRRILFKEAVKAKHAEGRTRHEAGLPDEEDHANFPYDPTEDTSIPDWARLPTDSVRPKDEILPDRIHDVAHFMHMHLIWQRDQDAMEEKKKLNTLLRQSGVLGSSTTDKDTGGEKCAPTKSAEVTDVNDEGVTSMEIGLPNPDHLPAPQLIDMEDPAVAQDITASLLVDEINEDGKEEDRKMKLRTSFQKAVASLKLSDLETARVEAVIKTYKAARTTAPDDKVVIFSQSVKFLDVLAEAMSRTEHGSIAALRFDGDLADSTRSITLSDFFAAKPDRPLLASVGAAGNGINLSCANRAIFCEALWNAQDEQQVRDRLHRQPQKKEVYIYRIFGANSSIDWLISITRDKKWATIKPIMDQLCRKKDVKLEIPAIPQHFVPICDVPYRT